MEATDCTDSDGLHAAKPCTCALLLMHSNFAVSGLTFWRPQLAQRTLNVIEFGIDSTACGEPGVMCADGAHQE